MPEVTAHFVNEQRKAVAPEEWRGSWAARPLLGLLMVERMKKKFRVLGDGARGSHMARPGAERSAGGCRCRRRERAGRVGWMLEAGTPLACDQATQVGGSKMPTARVSCNIP